MTTLYYVTFFLPPPNPLTTYVDPSEVLSRKKFLKKGGQTPAGISLLTQKAAKQK
jgi:hypothetical protein